MKASALLVALCAFLPTGSAQSPQRPRNPGLELKSLSNQSHNAYIAGVGEGYTQAYHLTMSLTGDLPPADDYRSIRSIGLTANQQAALKTIAQDVYFYYEIERVGTAPVALMMDSLYTDRYNTLIPWVEMVRLSVSHLRGVVDADWQQQLGAARAASVGAPTPKRQ